MWRRRLRSVFLLTWVVYCASGIPDDLQQFASLMPTVPEEPLPLVCTPFLKHSDGKNYNFTLNQYMESEHPTFVECQSSVSAELKNIFRNTSESAELRKKLRGSLGNVCALYGEMFSIVARMRKNGTTLQMCDDDALVDATVKDRKFCEVASEPEEALAAEKTQTTLDALGFSNYSSSLSYLLSLGADCPSRCGEGNGRILCNAYYSMATVLKNVMLKASLDEVDDTAPAVPAMTPPPVMPPPTGNNDNPPLPIEELLDPMWSVPQSTLLKLIAGDTGYRRKTLTALLSDFTAEDLKRFLARPDLVTIMRIFWVVRLVYDRLSVMDERELWFSTHRDNLFYKGEFEQDNEDMVKNFEDVDTILNYIHEKRTLLFAKGRHATEPPPTKEVYPLDLIPSLGGLNPPHVYSEDGGSEITTPQVVSSDTPQSDHDHHTEPPSDNNLGPQFRDQLEDLLANDLAFRNTFLSADNSDDRVQVLKNYLGEDLNIEQVLPILQEIIDGDVDSVKNGVGGGADSGKGGSAGEDDGDVDSVKNGVDGADSGNAGEEEDEGVEILLDAGLVGGDGDITDKPPYRGYGAFHFLGLFLVIAAAAVVGYLCMHNRKKLREGVNGYMSGSGHRKRTRNYKPLATSEA